MQLYKLADDYLKLQSDESFTAEEIADTLEGIEGEFNDKAENIISLMKSLSSESDSFKVEAKRLSAIATAKQNTATKLKEYLKGELIKLNKTSFSAGVHKASIRKGVQAVEVINADNIPADLVKIEISQTPDKKEILKRLKNDEKIEGVKLIRNPDSITIK